ncbi:low-density lipoprotein receptor-related protein 4 [Biomphalaria glabrata]|nr:low-density lipoprotein receptor-related protein 4 [Biomphalaria glabrata]
MFLIYIALFVSVWRCHLIGAINCFKCANVADPGQCGTLSSCAGDELCFMEKKLTGGLNVYYNLGCEKQLACDALGGGDTIVGKKRNMKTRPPEDRTKRDVTLCNKCCSTDNCNQLLCSDLEKPTDSVPASSDIYVRLVGGSNAYEGTVEVFFNGRWGSICDDNWTNNDAQVVCNMLGYQGNGAQAFGGGYYYPGQNVIWLTNVTCGGTEPSLYQCQHGQWGVTQCLHNQDAGIACSSVTPEDDVIFLLDTGFGGVIFRMNLRTMSFTPIPLSTLYSPESFDYDPSLGRIYFVDARLLQIISMKFDGTDIRVIKQLDTNTRLDKIQIDPLNRMIFYSDDGNNLICSMNMDGSNFTQVIKSNLDNPRGIVLDPRSKTLYWTDWGAQPKIEAASYDGSNRRTLVNNNIKWPNGLAIDYDTNKLYFVDGGLGTIETITLQGTSRREIYKDAGAHLFSIDVFDEYLYYTDWNRDTLMRIRKDGSGQTVVGPPSFRELSDVRVQKYGKNIAGVTTPSPVHFDPSHVFVRMSGVGDATGGRVEIFANSQWGTICDDHWDDNDAKVVCHMMGFSRENAKATSQSNQGSGFGIISLDEVNCTGTENHIVDCGFGPQNWAVHDCTHNEDAGVICEAPEALHFQESNIDNFLVFCDVVSGLLIRMDLNTYR